MQSMTTAPSFSDFSTITFDEPESEVKNQKVSGARCALIRKANDSSMTTDWPTIDDYLACDINTLDINHFTHDPNLDVYRFPSTKENINKIIAAFKNGINNQNVTRLWPFMLNLMKL